MLFKIETTSSELHETLRRIESLLRLQYYHDYSRANGKIIRGGLPDREVISKILKQDETIAFALHEKSGKVEDEQAPEFPG